MTRDPDDLRWADPDQADSTGQREIIIAILNLTCEVRSLSGHLSELVSRDDLTRREY